MPLGGHSTVSRALHFSTALRFSCSLTFPFSWADRRGGMVRCSRLLGMSTRKRMTSEADDNGSSQLKSDNSLEPGTAAGIYPLRRLDAPGSPILTALLAPCPLFRTPEAILMNKSLVDRRLVHQKAFSCTTAPSATLPYIRRPFPVQTVSFFRLFRAEEQRYTMIRRGLCTGGLDLPAFQSRPW